MTEINVIKICQALISIRVPLETLPITGKLISSSSSSDDNNVYRDSDIKINNDSKSNNSNNSHNDNNNKSVSNDNSDKSYNKIYVLLTQGFLNLAFYNYK